MYTVLEYSVDVICPGKGGAKAEAGESLFCSATGHTVVYNGMISVVTEPIFAGQFKISGAHVEIL